MLAYEPKYLTSEKEILDYLEKTKAVEKTLFVYSCGRNWGYGGSTPVDLQSSVVSLEKMNKIISFDEELGIIDIEPGVTQGQLEEYLMQNNYPYFVPNTGAGSRGSLLGNALERGFGISPISDHASAIVNIRGILANGEIYQSPLSEVSEELSKVFPWGVGLCTDKLISQSSWIVITRVSLQLVKKLPYSDTLIFKVDDLKMKEFIENIRELHFELTSHLSSIKIFDSQQIQKSFDKSSLGEKQWFIFIGFYSIAGTRNAIRKVIKGRLAKKAEWHFLVNEGRLSILNKFLFFFPKSFFIDLKQKIAALTEYQRMVDGWTSEIGYHILDNRSYPNKKNPFDMGNYDKDIAWLSPLCPMKYECFNKLIQWLESKERSAFCEFRAKTWTTLNSRCMALVICLAYEKEKKTLFWNWYNELLVEMKELGFIPYRFPIQSFPILHQKLLPKHFKRVSQIEKCLDPESVLQNKRYHY